MAANQYGIDLGSIIQTKDALDQNALRKTLAQRQIAADDRSIANQNTLTEYLPAALGGDQEALAKVTGANPTLGMGLETRRREMDKQTREQMAKEAPIFGRLFANVKDQPTWTAAVRAADASGLDVKKLPMEYDPDMVGRIVQTAQAFTAPKNPMSVPAGATIYDPQTNKPIFTAPAAEKTVTPGKLENLIAARDKLPQGDPRRKLYDDAISKETTNTPLVAIDQKAEGEEAKQFGNDLVKEYTGIRERADAAEQSLRNLQIARAIPVQTGALAPLKAKVGALGQALGVKPETLQQFGLDQATTAEAFTGVMQKLVLSEMQAQKGPQTESDAKRIELTVSNLGNTQEAADFLMRTGIAMRKRDIEQRSFFDKYRAEKKTFDGAPTAWRKYIAETPLLGENPNSKFPVFYDEFMEGVKQANPGASDDQIFSLWRQKYGRK